MHAYGHSMGDTAQIGEEFVKEADATTRLTPKVIDTQATQHGVETRSRAGDAHQMTASLDSMPALPTSAARLSLALDFPGYDRLLHAADRRDTSAFTANPALATGLSLKPLPALVPDAPVLTALLPGLSLGSVPGVRHEKKYDSRKPACARDSVDAADGAELLRTCTASSLTPDAFAVGADREGDGKARFRPVLPAPSLPPVPDSCPSQLLKFDSDIQLARIQARYAALDARQQIRYEPPNSHRPAGSPDSMRAGTSPGSATPLVKHPWADNNSGDGKYNVAGARAGREDQGIPRSESAWSLFGMRLRSRQGRAGSQSGGGLASAEFGGSLGASSKCTFSAGWRRWQQLLIQSSGRRQGAGTEAMRVVSGRTGRGARRVRAASQESACDDAELPTSLLSSRDSRVVHRARLGMDVRPPELERSLSVFSMARDESGQLLTCLSPLATVKPGCSALPSATGSPRTSHGARQTAAEVRWVWLRGNLANRQNAGASCTAGGPLGRPSLEDLFTPVCAACKGELRVRTVQTDQGMLGSAEVLHTAVSLQTTAAALVDLPATRSTRYLSQPERGFVVAVPAGEVPAAAQQQQQASGPGSARAQHAVSLAQVKPPRTLKASTIWPVAGSDLALMM